MRKYETFFIVDPDLPDEVNTVIDDKVKNVVTGNGGSILSYTPWGKKKLAYPVKKRSRGHYVLMEYIGGPELVAELERNMRLDERVLKFITVKLDDHYDPEKEEARKAASPRRFGEEEEGAGAVEGASEEFDQDVEASLEDEEEIDEEEE